MPTVLAIVAGLPPSLDGRPVTCDRLTIDLYADAARPLATSGAGGYDLLVLAGMGVEEQQALAAAFQRLRCWRAVPVLYVHDPDIPGFAIPGSYRPELDGIVRGSFESPAVHARLREMAKDGASQIEVVTAGPYELDPRRGRLRATGADIRLTEREAEILSMLLCRPNQIVSAAEILERGWCAPADSRHLQILRRHMSNIRRKLGAAGAGGDVRTIRGAGYQFELGESLSSEW